MINKCFSEAEAEIMRASSWLYQYSSQTKFTYGVCPATATSSQQSPGAPLAPYEPLPDYNRVNNHGNINNSSIVANYVEMTPYQSQDNEHDLRWHNKSVKQEPVETIPSTYVEPHMKIRKHEDEHEPVDMSINNSTCPNEHDEGHNPDYCPCSNDTQLSLVSKRIN